MLCIACIADATCWPGPHVLDVLRAVRLVQALQGLGFLETLPKYKPEHRRGWTR